MSGAGVTWAFTRSGDVALTVGDETARLSREQARRLAHELSMALAREERLGRGRPMVDLQALADQLGFDPAAWTRNAVSGEGYRKARRFLLEATRRGATRLALAQFCDRDHSTIVWHLKSMGVALAAPRGPQA